MYLHLPFSSFSIPIKHISVLLAPLITTALLNSCHSFTLPAQEKLSLTLYKLPSHKQWDLKCFWDNSLFHEKWKQLYPHGYSDKDSLYLSLLQHFYNSLFAPCRGGNTDHSHVRPSCDRHTVPPNIARPPHLDKVIRGKKNPSNFNCGHFKTRISS